MLPLPPGEKASTDFRVNRPGAEWVHWVLEGSRWMQLPRFSSEPGEMQGLGPRQPALAADLGSWGASARRSFWSGLG